MKKVISLSYHVPLDEKSKSESSRSPSPPSKSSQIHTSEEPSVAIQPTTSPPEKRGDN